LVKTSTVWALPCAGAQLRPYTYEDITRTLNDVAAYDWDGFFRTRIREIAPRAPLGGVEHGGWRLMFRDEQTDVERATDAVRGTTSFAFDLGFVVGQDGTLADVLLQTPAAVAGLGPGMRIVAVNGRSYSSALLRDALRLGKTSTAPLELLMVNSSFYRSYSIDYHGGERHPVLEREPSQPDLLTQILEPLVSRH
jgi:predicted metalloprotease with PDZ domain